ncbi:hypothetical protein L4C36_07310 [Photobacterium japonica]|uniref:hypothetical protein n=1 Tax=Photobacterium japonica TaxID=2910235 RepID=UPI003D0DE755
MTSKSPSSTIVGGMVTRMGLGAFFNGVAVGVLSTALDERVCDGVLGLSEEDGVVAQPTNSMAVMSSVHRRMRVRSMFIKIRKKNGLEERAPKVALKRNVNNDNKGKRLLI